MRGALWATLVLAAFLRFWRIADPALGLNQDEAVNAWNAYCLLHTGHDAHGAPWPQLYYHALGENRSAQFLYFLLPGQALFGLNRFSLRLPCALGGVLHVLMLALLARRLFGPRVGLLAALILALNPWDIYLSRWGHEGAVTGVVTTAVLALVAACVMAGAAPHRPSALASQHVAALAPQRWAALALRGVAATAPLLIGLIAGVACWGYPALRLALPPILLSWAALAGPAWWRAGRNQLRGAALIIGFLIGLSPLIYEHVFHPERIARRSENLWVWSADDNVAERLGHVALRYIRHYDPQVLFRVGDAYGVAWPAGFGFFPVTSGVLLVVGFGRLVRASPGSFAARAALAWLVLFPLGDSLHTHVGQAIHVLRAAVGCGALVLTMALGLDSLLLYLQLRRAAALLIATATVFGGGFVAHSVGFLDYALNRRALQTAVYRAQHVDLVRAGPCLRERLHEVDRVIVTPTEMNMPAYILLVTLAPTAQAWLTEPRTFEWQGGWHVCTRWGQFNFPPSPAAMRDIAAQPPVADAHRRNSSRRTMVICRPGECASGEVLATFGPTRGAQELELRLLEN